MQNPHACHERGIWTLPHSRGDAAQHPDQLDHRELTVVLLQEQKTRGWNSRWNTGGTQVEHRRTGLEVLSDSC